MGQVSEKEILLAEVERLERVFNELNTMHGSLATLSLSSSHEMGVALAVLRYSVIDKLRKLANRKDLVK